MRIVQTVDENDRKLRWLVSDTTSDADADEFGIYAGVPDLSAIDWEEAEIKIHNLLYDMGLFTIDDVTRREGMLSAVVLAVLKKKIVSLYTEGDND